MTTNGDHLALQLQRRFYADRPAGDLHMLPGICARLCRTAPRYARMQERSCNEDPGSDATAASWERAEATLEATIEDIFLELPNLANGDVLKPLLQGDPRGHTIKVIAIDHVTSESIERGDEIGVPGS